VGYQESEEVEGGEELVVAAEARVEAGALVVNGAVFGPITENVDRRRRSILKLGAGRR